LSASAWWWRRWRQSAASRSSKGREPAASWWSRGRRSGIVAAWSTILLLPLALIDGFASLRAVGPAILLGQVVSQGILSGIVALACYGIAVRALGSSRAALLAALPPALAALLAVPLLGEIPSALSLLGVALAVAGVALGSGAIRIGG
jgi:drug/metabolite transporter (DMT)-like permease